MQKKLDNEFIQEIREAKEKKDMKVVTKGKRFENEKRRKTESNRFFGRVNQNSRTETKKDYLKSDKQSPFS